MGVGTASGGGCGKSTTVASHNGGSESRGCSVEGAVVVSSLLVAADGSIKEREKESGVELLLCTTNEWCRDISNVISAIDIKING